MRILHIWLHFISVFDIPDHTFLCFQALIMTIIELAMDDKTIPNACVVKKVEQQMLSHPESTTTTTKTTTSSTATTSTSEDEEDLSQSIENELEKISKSRPKKKISNSNSIDDNSAEDYSAEDDLLEKSDCLEDHCHQVPNKTEWGYLQITLNN